jgi:hypothetical protein
VIRSKIGFLSGITPLSCFSGGGLLIMASGRLAHAITVTVAILWIFCLTSLTAFIGARFFPRYGRLALLAFLASFFAGIFLLLLWFFSPFCAMETLFAVSLVALLCLNSSLYRELEAKSLSDVMYDSAIEALSISVFIVFVALIREPLGYASLSLPGGSQGIVFLFSSEMESLLPIRLAANSSGAFLLLGYFLAVYRRRNRALQEGK